jgi:hypothetical protein
MSCQLSSVLNALNKSLLEECGCEEKTLYMIFGLCNSVRPIVLVLKFVARERQVETVIY